jgi:hypothetical protein
VWLAKPPRCTHSGDWREEQKPPVKTWQSGAAWLWLARQFLGRPAGNGRAGSGLREGSGSRPDFSCSFKAKQRQDERMVVVCNINSFVLRCI